MNEIEAYKKLSYILNSLQPYSIDLTLDRIKLFLEQLGNPQDSFKSIIVGGTNGKGSVCQFLTDTFIDANIRVGTYTSPHLIQLNERFRINNKSIDYEMLLKSAERLKSLDSLGLTYFEFLTAMAFDVFQKEGVEVAILEVGMGGEFDATNVVNPILSIITHISLDHTEHLGKTHKKIAKTKAKIIKNIGIIGKNSNIVKETIKKSTNAKLFFVDRFYEKKAEDIKTVMRGKTVKENLSTALFAIDILNSVYNFNLNGKAVQRSFWPGRFEIIETDRKTFILDGAHNKNAIFKLASSIKGYDDKILIFSALKNKSWKDNLNMLLPLFKKIVIAPLAEHRLAESVKNMREAIEDKKNVVVCNSVNEAINYSLSCKEKVVVVTGSLYLVGEAKACNIYESFMP